MDLKLLFDLIVIVFLLFLNGFFVAAEFALVGVRKTKIKQLCNEGNFNAKLALDAIKNLDKYIAAVQLGITIASLGIGWVGESALARLITPLFKFLPANYDSVAAHTISAAIAFAVITVLHVVIGELMPKSVALQFPTKTTLWVAKPMYIITRLFAPFVYLLNGLGAVLLKLCGIEPAQTHTAAHSPEELNMLIDASYKGGALNAKEAEMLQNVFKFSELSVSQIMLPRPDMVCIPLNVTTEDLHRIIIENKYTRYPVYENDLDHIAGILNIKDIYTQVIEGKEINIKSLLRDVYYIPETMPVETLAIEFQQRHLQMAIVVDEFGGTSGLITHEDVLEEIFGEVQDEFDEDEEVEVKQISDDVYEICGKMRTDEFCDTFNVKLDDDEDINTVGGYFIKKLGRIAREKDEIADEYFKYCVTKTDSSRIVKLKIQKIKQAPSETI